MLEMENAVPATVQGFRLAPQQRRLWALRAAESRAYHVRCAARLTGPLAPDALAAALAEVVARHEILRTVFRRAPGTKFPVQVIEAHLPPLWRAVDLSGLGEAEQRERVAALSAEEDERPFDVERGTLLRATLVTLSASSHALLLRAHVLVADAAGLQNVLAEVARAYGLRGGDADADSDEEPVQYADLAEWQNELFEADEAATGAAHWRELDLAAARRMQPPYERDAAQSASQSKAQFNAQSEAQSEAPSEARSDAFLPRAVAVPLDAATAAAS
ncbi:MAG TPA: condensation domain-containing protein, partial [Pyrinomonadaceae bacterium]